MTITFRIYNIICSFSVDPDSAMTVNLTASPSIPQQNSAFILTCLATKSPHLTQTPTIDWYDAGWNRIVTDLERGIRVGEIVVTSDGTVIRSLTFLSLDVSHSMDYRCNASIQFLPPPYIVSKEVVWNLIVHNQSKCTHNWNNVHYMYIITIWHNTWDSHL